MLSLSTSLRDLGCTEAKYAAAGYSNPASSTPRSRAASVSPVTVSDSFGNHADVAGDQALRRLLTLAAHVEHLADALVLALLAVPDVAVRASVPEYTRT